MKPIVERLGNGLRVVMLPQGSAPVVAFQMWVGVGSADEREGEEGLAHVFEHMLFKGTGKRKVGQIARDVERAGGNINAWTSHDETVFFITLASRYWKRGLDILADAIMNPSLDRAELQRELDVILEEIRMGEDSPDRVVIERLFREVYRRHPYGRPVIGYADTVRGFTRRKVAAFYKRWYVPSNMVLVVAGDFEPGAMRKAIEGSFHAFGGPSVRKPPRPEETTQRRARATFATRPIAESHLSIGFPIPGLRHRDVPALDLLAAVLGQGASSRLEINVKRRISAVTAVRSMAYTPPDAGIFGVFAIAPLRDLERAASAIADEVCRLIEEPVMPAEIEKGRTLLESDKVYSEETVEGIARKLGYYSLHADDVDFEVRYLAALKELGPEDLMTAASTYLLENRGNISAVLPDPARNPVEESLAWVSVRGKSQAIDSRRLGQALLGNLQKIKRKDSVNKPTRRTPQTVLFELSTGDTLIVQHDPAAKLVAARSAFFGGLRGEPAAKAGMAALMSASLIRGTTRLCSEEIALAMDALACSIGGFAGRNTIGVTGEFLMSNYEKGFSLMADCLRHPSFPEDEVSREKELMIEEIRSSQDNPGQQVFRIFFEAMFGRHPYSRFLMGTEDTVSALTGKDLMRHLKKLTGPGTMVMAVVGGAEPESVRDIVEESLPRGGKPGSSVKPPSPWSVPKRPKQVTRNLPKEQSHIIIGFPGTSLTSEDRYQVEMITEILGGHGGRLFAEVRDRKGLAYAVSATSLEGIEPGYVALYAATSPGQEQAVVQAMLEEVSVFVKTPPSKQELARVKSHLIGSRAIALQRTSTRAANMSLDYLYGNGYDASEKYPGQIEKISPEDLLAAAIQYLDRERMIVACAGPNVDELKLL